MFPRRWLLTTRDQVRLIATTVSPRTPKRRIMYGRYLLSATHLPRMPKELWDKIYQQGSSPMNPSLSELKNILTSELKVYDELIGTAGEMNDALKGRDIEAVRSFTLNYDNGFVKIESLEERRLAIADMVRESVGLPGRHLTLQQIADVVNREDREELLALRTELKRRIAALSRINVSNRILLEESLAGMAKNVELMTATQKSAPVYGQKGTIAREPLRTNIVNRTA
ncbi:MAG: hypothetical protein GF344_18925 [Chitinivibrionales bacterium]|nr:hypothetical protein [Chitinivibrionales bacterium]MBD3358708.1 hypothetical protein [Chitinivibrionales bacterium]